MLERLAGRLGLRTEPNIFFWSAGLMVAFLILLVALPDQVGTVFTQGREWITEQVGWFFILGGSARS